MDHEHSPLASSFEDRMEDVNAILNAANNYIILWFELLFTSQIYSNLQSIDHPSTSTPYKNQYDTAYFTYVILETTIKTATMTSNLMSTEKGGEQTQYVSSPLHNTTLFQS